jgi:hypothetical protein
VTRPDPYVVLGLKGNPFVRDVVTEVPGPFWVARGFFEAPPVSGGVLVQVVGPKGCGKTAHLRRWRSRTGGPLRHVAPGWRRWRPMPLAPITYWDEADRVPPVLLRMALCRAARLGATVVVGTHEDLGRAARSAGLRVITCVVPPLNAETLLAWARPRILAARLADDVEPRLHLDAATAADIVAACGASLRDAASLLHAWAACEAARVRPLSEICGTEKRGHANFSVASVTPADASATTNPGPRPCRFRSPQ